MRAPPGRRRRTVLLRAVPVAFAQVHHQAHASARSRRCRCLGPGARCRAGARPVRIPSRAAIRSAPRLPSGLPAAPPRRRRTPPSPACGRRTSAGEGASPRRGLCPAALPDGARRCPRAPGCAQYVKRAPRPRVTPLELSLPRTGNRRPGRKPAIRRGRAVAGWSRRVVVARRCTAKHLRRVMVETPPRAGPSPPPTDRPVFFSPARPAEGAPRARPKGPRAPGEESLARRRGALRAPAARPRAPVRATRAGGLSSCRPRCSSPASTPRTCRSPPAPPP